MLDPQIREKIQIFAKRYPQIKKLTLFGSFARGDDSRTSDLDLYLEGELERAVFLAFESELNLQLPTLRKIDLLQGEDIKKALLDSIRRDGILIYENR